MLGIAIAFTVGAAAISDELALLLGRDNPYWGDERKALIQGATAAGTAVVLATRFYPTESGTRSDGGA